MGIRQADKPAWYRAKTYKGKMTERQKRHLDAVRLQDQHPATSFAMLPEDVQNYISRIELELFDAKKSEIFWSSAVVFVSGAFILYKEFLGSAAASGLSIAMGVLLMIFSALYWSINSRKLSNAFLPDSDWAGPTNEGIRQEWEIEYLSRLEDGH